MRRRTALWICSAPGCSREAASASKMASLWVVTESPCARQCAAKVSTWERSSVRVGRFCITRAPPVVSRFITPYTRSSSERTGFLAVSRALCKRVKGTARPEAARAHRRGPARAPERPLPCRQAGRERLTLQVVVDELRHLEHRDGLLAAEDLAERLVGVDVPLLLLVLQIVLLHVGPDLLHHLRAGDGFFADDLGESRVRRHRLHERGVRLAGGLLRGGLLGGLLRGHLRVLLLEGHSSDESERHSDRERSSE